MIWRSLHLSGKWMTCSIWYINTFYTVEQGPRSSWLCSFRPWNEGLVPWILHLSSLKTWPDWNRFQNKLPFNEGENSIISNCVLTFKLAKIRRLVQEILVSEALNMLSMDFDCKHKDGNLDDGLVLDSEWIWEEECEIVSESNGRSPLLLGPREATHSELLGMKRVNTLTKLR